jgi:hypothetical protein
MACLYGQCVTGIAGCDCDSLERLCDTCGGRLHTGMPDGREFLWLHLNGMSHCLLPHTGREGAAVAAWHGTTGARYA